MDGEDIGFLDAGRIDALMALHMRQRRQPVAIDGGALEIEIFGGLVHRLGHCRLDLLALAGQEVLRLLHQFGIVVVADLTRAGRRAALDLVEQAGPGAGLEDAVGAGADAGRRAAAN